MSEISPRPYLWIEDRGYIYEVKDDRDYLEWVDDSARKITLYYKGKELK